MSFSTSPTRICSRPILLGALFVLLLTPFGLESQEYVRYQIEGSFDDVTSVLSAAATVTGHESATRDGSLHLDLPFRNEITVMSVTGSRGEALRHETSPTGEFLFVDVSGLGAHEQVSVSYSIQLEDDPQPFGYHLLSDPTGSRWYPKVVNSEGESDHFSDFVVALDVPEDYGLLTTGGYGDRETGGGGLSRVTWRIVCRTSHSSWGPGLS